MPRYQEFIEWIAFNDDDFVDESTGTPSITVSMVADLYNKNPEQIIEEVRVVTENHKTFNVTDIFLKELKKLAPFKKLKSNSGKGYKSLFRISFSHEKKIPSGINPITKRPHRGFSINHTMHVTLWEMIPVAGKNTSFKYEFFINNYEDGRENLQAARTLHMNEIEFKNMAQLISENYKSMLGD